MERKDSDSGSSFIQVSGEPFDEDAIAFSKSIIPDDGELPPAPAPVSSVDQDAALRTEILKEQLLKTKFDTRTADLNAQKAALDLEIALIITSDYRKRWQRHEH